MDKVITTAKKEAAHLPHKVSRARSLPSRKSFDHAVILSMVHYLGVIAAITALVYCLREPSQTASELFVGALLFSVVSWVLALFKRRCTHCPLCKGTPLINSGALTHKRATRIFPLNHGVSATLTIIAAQRFRCMYCGTDYDLLKHSSRLHSGGRHNCATGEDSKQRH